MSSLEKFISEEFKLLKLYSREADNILTIELCDYLYTSDAQYIDKCYEKAMKIFECINYKEDELFIVANIYKEKDYNYKEKINIERYLKNKKVLKSLNCISTDGKDVDSSVVDENEYISHYYLSCKTKDLNYKKLILDLCKHDLGFKVKRMHDYFIINKNKKICFRMMDDRFVDLIFNDLEFDKEKWINIK
ncbi:TPA: hypothetical protein KOS69_003670 [Clostridioides difficile]|uniref:DUF3885 domain-containing protein n=3 Tax=Clostridioides difficile TaxID=1496 RepID=UPI00093C3746|nr:hypothetical protein [Clostridioides difficile]EGT5475384.1 hypothetical protein [Clostridioides difficile]MBG0257302.1 hypothetical protein [Clostridioides difficile]MCA0551406.1 hypothetical protein [Clostridioides difficile]MDM9941690.1 hypothetical protein [Clostridioides difficile]MDV9292176.1 hypothetical protein [Clostridioides difficile]